MKKEFLFEDAKGIIDVSFNEELNCYIGSIEWQGVKGTISFRDESHISDFISDENGEMTRFINGLCFSD